MERSLEFYINDSLLDVSTQEQMRFFLTFSIADINSLEVIKNSVSKTIAFAGTDNNRKLFGFAELPSAGSGLDQTTKPPFRIDYDGTSILHGFVKMVEPRYDIGNKLSEYKVVVVGDNGDWKADIKDKNLNELDFSEQDHTYNKANIDTSETVDASRDYVYPLINYGQPRGTIGAINISTKDVAIEDRVPAWQVSSLVEKLFNAIGYKLSSNFFSGSGFGTKIYLPFSNEALLHDASFTANGSKHFNAGNDPVSKVDFLAQTNNNIKIIPAVKFDDTTNSPFFDTDGLYNTSTNEYIVGVSSRMEFHTVINNDGIESTTKWMTVRFKKNGVSFSEKTFEFAPNFRNSVLAHSSGYHNYVNGDEISVELEVRTAGTGIASWSIFGNATVFWNTVSREVVSGSVNYPINNSLPDILQTDFLDGLKKMFNLYFYADLDSKTIIIEPRDDFYTGTALVWTDKINHFKTIKSRYLGENLNRTIRYKFTEDSEDKFVNELYEKVPPERKIGVHDEVIANQFSPAGIKEITCGFSPTYMTNFPSIGFRATFVPHMRHEFKKWWDASATWFTKFNHRILYYDGVQTCLGDEEWTFDTVSRTDYPSFYSYSNLIENENSLIFNDGGKSVGLFNKFFKNTHRIIDEGKVITMEVYLTEKDINTLNFRTPIEIEIDGDVGQYTLNKIPKYTPVSKGSSIVEFLQFLDVHPPPTSKQSSEILTDVVPDHAGDPIDAGGGKTDIDIDEPFDNVALGGVMGGGTPSPPIKKTLNLSRGMIPNLDGQVLLGQYGRPSTRFPVIIGGGADEATRENSVVVDEQGVVLGREGLAGFTLLPALNLIDSSIAPITEVDGDIYLLDDANGELEVDSILWQSGTIVRYSSAGADLSGVTAGDWLRITGSTNAINDGTFIIKTVNDGSDFIELNNERRIDATDDEGTSPAKMSAVFTDYDGAGQGDWVRYNSTDDLWYNIPVQVGMKCYSVFHGTELRFTGSLWIIPAGPFEDHFIIGFDLQWMAGVLITQIGLQSPRNLCRDQLNTHDITGFAGGSINNLGAPGANGLDTGTVAASTWYYIFVISSSTDPVTFPDASLASLTPVTPSVLPTGYDKFRMVGMVVTDSAGTAIESYFQVFSPFSQHIRRYYWDRERAGTIFNLSGGRRIAFTVIPFGVMLPNIQKGVGHLTVEYTVASASGNKARFKPTGMAQVDPPHSFTEPSVSNDPLVIPVDIPWNDPAYEYKIDNALDFVELYCTGFTHSV